MKKEQAKPVELTTVEMELLENYFWLPGWQFEKLIGRNCREIEAEIIRWTGKKGEREPEYATTYGLDAIRSDTQKYCTANFFVQYKFRVYQANRLEGVMEIVRLLKKEAGLDAYQDAVWKQKEKLRKQTEKKAEKQKGSINW